MDPEVTEVIPGELDVRLADGTHRRVVVPAGVGVAGADDESFAGALVRVLVASGEAVPAVVDASRLLTDDPGLVSAVEHELGLA